jgi:hypothetical protein
MRNNGFKHFFKIVAVKLSSDREIYTKMISLRNESDGAYRSANDRT